MKSKKLALWLVCLCIVALVTTMVGCDLFKGDDGAETEAPVVNTDKHKDVVTPEADKFGVVSAAKWREAYPDEVASYEDNKNNVKVHNYLEIYPALVNLYAGYGFSKGYNEAEGHVYTLSDLKDTPRTGPASFATCITCKTPQFTAVANSVAAGADVLEVDPDNENAIVEGGKITEVKGIDIYSQNFLATIDNFDEPISCYNCHENDPSGFIAGNKFFVAALGDDAAKIPARAQVCGQCHNEYYINPPDKAITNPYKGLAEMTPDAILAYYDEWTNAEGVKGFADWEYPEIGTKMIKIQHPEFETIYGGDMNKMATQKNKDTGEMWVCADCHMGKAANADGVEYSSHYWRSPLNIPGLIENTCSDCHADLKAEVEQWTSDNRAAVKACSEELEKLVAKMGEQVAAGTLTGDNLAAAQKLHREAQFYWDFTFVENSYGAHNRALANDCLDKANERIAKLAKLLG
ncbi:MAG: ammonia-forming cytochrome c nitrite reductase subunit c552 [Coriobacteriia bacterium]|nr:ammonia-forming cytochrome c nitrite reductase subunit c552 [Coriobacteriia bacterium]